jgi:methionyl-tRNA formyltransferase
MPFAATPPRPDVSPPPRIGLLCATRRGVAFAQRLLTLRPDAEVAVCTFPEEPWEPRYVDDLRILLQGPDRHFRVARQVAPADLFAGQPFDLLFAVSWRYILKPEVYGRAQRGAFVFHDSLLPKRCGFAPTPWAIIEGERTTGVTLLEMAEAVDRGRIVDQIAVPIAADEYIDSVLARVTDGYLHLLERHLSALLAGTAPLREQNHAEATYCTKRRPEDNRIAWGAPATTVFNLIRACSTPYPGAFCFRDGKRLTIWQADAAERIPGQAAAPMGQVVERVPGAGARVGTGDGTLLLRTVQLEGGPVVRADELLRPSEVLT